MNDLKVFQNERFGAVRTVIREGQPWFVAADVCKALEIGNTSKAMLRLEEEEKKKITIVTNGGGQPINCVNKNGLMVLVLGSRKKERVSSFKKWLMEEVFPELGIIWRLDDIYAQETVANDACLMMYNSDQFGNVRVKKDELGEPWFVATDVCRILGLADTSQAMERIDGTDKRVFNGIRTASNTLSAWCVNEPGLYTLIMESIKPEAKEFRRWITHEVIPAIRRHGAYLTDEATDALFADPDTFAALAVKWRDERKARLEAEAQARQHLEKIRQDAPKVLFASSVEASSTGILIGALAKILRQNGVEVGQNRLFERMRKDGYLISRPGSDWNMPSQRSMEAGFMRIKESTVTHADGHISVNKTPIVTGKGQVFFINKYRGAFGPERPC